MGDGRDGVDVLDVVTGGFADPFPPPGEGRGGPPMAWNRPARVPKKIWPRHTAGVDSMQPPISIDHSSGGWTVVSDTS